MELAKKELSKLNIQGLSKAQLQKLKVQFLGQLSIASESNNARCMANGKTLLVYDRIDALSETFRKIQAVKLEEINAVATKYFSPENVCELVYDKK
jgi:predicted Zn-dependent peptidase